MARCLGEGEYDVRFTRRATKAGPAFPIGDAEGYAPESGSWSRRDEATSEGTAVFGLAGDDGCGQVLSRLEPWRDELEIYRDDDLCWVGPIQDVLANPDSATVTVSAQDLSAWFDKRVLPRVVSRQQDVAVIFAEYIRLCLTIDNPGITIVTTPIGVLADRTVAAKDLKKLSAELAELARTGVDWTVANRTFYVGGTEITPGGRLAGTLVDEHFRTPPQTRRSGVGMVNDAYIRGNDITGHFGNAALIDGVLLQDVADESSIEDQRSADRSAETWWDRAHSPLSYLEGDNALDPSAPVSVDELICGVIVPVDVTGAGVVPVREDLRLESVAVSFDPRGEQITVALQPVGTTETT